METPISQLSNLCDRVHTNKERVTSTKDGKPWVALIPLEDLETLNNISDEQRQELLHS